MLSTLSCFSQARSLVGKTFRESLHHRSYQLVCFFDRPAWLVHGNQSVPCSTAIGNLPSPIQKTRAWALRLQPLYPEFQALGLSQAWVLRAALAECSPSRP